MIKPQFEVDRWNYKCPIDRNKVSQGSDNYQIKSWWFTSTSMIQKMVNCLPEFKLLNQHKGVSFFCKSEFKIAKHPPFLINGVFLFSFNSPPHRSSPLVHLKRDISQTIDILKWQPRKSSLTFDGKLAWNRSSLVKKNCRTSALLHKIETIGRELASEVRVCRPLRQTRTTWHDVLRWRATK